MAGPTSASFPILKSHNMGVCREPSELLAASKQNLGRACPFLGVFATNRTKGPL